MPRRFSFLPGIIAVLLASAAIAGPPFQTDDPETLEQGHWEFYMSAQVLRNFNGDLSGLGPLFEGNYGLTNDVQLHVIAPFAFQRPRGFPGPFGYGDTELGTKIRFLHETDDLPQVGIYPLVELPTGEKDDGLSNGQAQVYIPVWIQKSFGPWTTYGGAGYWFNPGPANRNWWFIGWEVQRKLTESFTLGAEVFHTTANTLGNSGQSSINLGGIYDISDTYHLMLSVGHSFQGPGQLEGYFGLQITFGPGGPGDKAAKAVK